MNIVQQILKGLQRMLEVSLELLEKTRREGFKVIRRNDPRTILTLFGDLKKHQRIPAPLG